MREPATSAGTRPSEDELIARYLAPLAGEGGLGLRDDAGVVTPAPGCDLVVTKDMLIAGIHFFPDDPPDAIARKALRVNLSDLAAKGAAPLGFLLGLGLPSNWTERWLAAFVAGLADDTRHFACPLFGGDTVKVPGPLSLSITAFGEVESGRMVRRAGTQAGDLLYVSGTIGDAAIGLRIRRGDPCDAGWIAALDPSAAEALRDRYLLPRPRLGLRSALLLHARSAMDVSDGLVGDLGKMLDLEGLSAAVSVAAVPLSPAASVVISRAPSVLEAALAGGDDYEVLCAIAPEKADAFEAEARRAGVPVAQIGMANHSPGGPIFRDASGASLAFSVPRFSHF